MLTLSDPNVGDFDFDRDTNARFHVTKLDFGFPEVRSSGTVDNRPQGHGTFDRTAYFGARTVSIEAFIEGDANVTNLRDRLAPYFDPKRRPYLITDLCEYRTPRRVKLRADQFSGAFAGRPDTVQLQWAAPDGIIEDAAESTITITPDSVAPGFWFPIEFPLTFPRDPGGSGESYPHARNLGTLEAEWVAVLHGAISKPHLELQETGEYVSFPGLNLIDGDYVVIDSRNKTVMAAGTSSRISTMDFARSTWFQLRLGLNTLRIFADSWGTNASCTVTWRNPYLL